MIHLFYRLMLVQGLASIVEEIIFLFINKIKDIASACMNNTKH